MCGIAGLLGGAASRHDAFVALANSMAAELRHRGPDDDGAWGMGHVALAQRRLAILDLSPAGRQPMASRSGRWVVVFNGEIYNHCVLRQDLLAAGHRFDGTGDTETLVEALEAWGLEPTLHRLNGMFALAAYDRDADELWLARDRLGEKPLYWSHSPRQLLFASELRGLRVVPGFRAEIDEQSVAALLRWSFIPHPFTIYRDVRQLAPGELLRARLDGGEVQVETRRWWDLGEVVDRASRQPPLVGPEADRELAALVDDAVAVRLLSDVPIGSFLSGGIDSALVAASAQRALGSTPLRTFTVSMPELGADEATDAAATAAAIGASHTTLALSRSDAVSLVGSMASVWDEPFADPSMVPTALLCRAVAGEVTVCLSGDGGDELFAGYNRHVFGERVARRAARLPQVIRGPLGRGLGAIPVSTLDRLGAGLRPVLPSHWRLPMVGDKVHKAAALLAADQDPWPVLAGVWSEDDLGVRPHLPESAMRADPTERMLLTDTWSVLADQMLVKTDRASMAASMEVRVPLIDHRLVELAWRIPIGDKASGGRGKLPLRRLAAARLPAPVSRRPKLGFDPPLGRWLRDDLRPWADDLIGSSGAVDAGWLSGPALQRVWTEHLSGRRNHDYRLWAVLMVESWLRRYHG